MLSLFQNFQRNRRNRAQALHLLNLDERLLNDVGLNRAAVYDMINRARRNPR